MKGKIIDDERFWFIGIGDVGEETLTILKREMMMRFNVEDLDQKVNFLYINSEYKTVDEFYDKLHNSSMSLVNKLDSYRFRVRVFFFADIAEENGGGKVIDVAIIVRNILDERPGYNKKFFYGYIFIPGMCSMMDISDEMIQANKNAYATLKEIDFFMSLENRGQTISLKYGPVIVLAKKNLFDSCNLVEKNGEKNGQKSSTMTLRDIVNYIIYEIETPICDERGFYTGIMMEDFVHWRYPQLETQIAYKSEKLYPRNANYVYSRLGISQCFVSEDTLEEYKKHSERKLNGNTLDSIDFVAEEIYKTLIDKMKFTSHIGENYGNICTEGMIIVPYTLHVLYIALEVYMRRRNDQFVVYLSKYVDSIVCIQCDISVAAFMLDWTKRAEEIYESDNKKENLHRGQSESGIDWIAEPNLYVKPLWESGEDKLGGRKREAEIISCVDELMDHLRNDLGMIEYNAEKTFPFYVYLIKESEEIEKYSAHKMAKEIFDILKIKDNHTEVDISQAKSEWDGVLFSDEDKSQLLAAGIMYKENIYYENMCMRLPAIWGIGKEVDTDQNTTWYLSKQIVRRNTVLKKKIENSVAIYDELVSLVKDHNAKIMREILEKKRISQFVYLYKFGYIRMDEVYNCLLVLYNAPEKVVLDMSDYRNVEKECWEYFLYKDWFLKLSDGDVERIMSQTVQKDDFPDDESWKEYRLQWQNWQENSLKPALNLRYSARQITQYIKFPMQTVTFEKAISYLDREDVNADDIREFYSDMINNYL